jgi:Exodeoxyribonuclease VII large subunit (EC 3.1.11.6)
MADGRHIYRVSEFAAGLRELLELSFPRVWIQGEISNLHRHASGHWYFTLKDASAQLRCAMFRGDNQRVRPPPSDGDEVLIRGRVGLYPARGDLQIVCDHMEPAGLGALLRAFEALKHRLEAEGLFDPAKRRPLPVYPRRIALLTSPGGAAIRDVLTTLRRRWPLAEVLLLPIPVQGAAAAPAIVEAFEHVPMLGADVLLLVRGGGSLEDLWAFNEEIVARAVAACPVPVVTGVGHETDTTIVDFVADLRAATPTAAAERATPDRAELQRVLAERQRALTARVNARLHGAGLQLERRHDALRLRHPRRRLQDAWQRLDELQQRMQRQTSVRLRRSEETLRGLQRRLARAAPDRRLPAARGRLEDLLRRLDAGVARQQALSSARLESRQRVLASLSPLAVLDRGYAILRDDEGRILRDATALTPGDRVQARLARGEAELEVRKISH